MFVQRLCLGYPHCLPPVLQQAQELGANTFPSRSNQHGQPVGDFVNFLLTEADSTELEAKAIRQKNANSMTGSTDSHFKLG